MAAVRVGAIRQLLKLLTAIDQVVEKPQPTEARPVYDRMNLALAIRSATGAFQEAWRSQLGLESRPGFAKEHWTRVKVLNRRLAAMGKDEYDTLRPVADLRQELRDRIYVFIQNSLHWEGPEPTEEEMQTKYDDLADSLSGRLLSLDSSRVARAHQGLGARLSGVGQEIDVRSGAHCRRRHLRTGLAGPGHYALTRPQSVSERSGWRS